MKKLIMIISLAMLLLLAGCVDKSADDKPAKAPAQAEPAATPPAAPVPPMATTAPLVSPPAVTPAPSAIPPAAPAPSTQPYEAPATPPAPVPISTPSADSYTDLKVKGLVAKASSKVTSYSFLYQSSDNWDVIRDRYFIKGNKMKIDLYDVNLYNKRNYFDMVYLDMGAKSGVAYCEDRHHERCTDPEREFEVSYEDFLIKTPMDWMMTLPPSAKAVGTETFDKHLSTIIEYTSSGGVITRIWVDTFSGLPLKVIFYEDEVENALERYGYRDLSVNSVKTVDVEHQ